MLTLREADVLRLLAAGAPTGRSASGSGSLVARARLLSPHHGMADGLRHD